MFSKKRRSLIDNEPDFLKKADIEFGCSPVYWYGLLLTAMHNQNAALAIIRRVLNAHKIVGRKQEVWVVRHRRTKVVIGAGLHFAVAQDQALNMSKRYRRLCAKEGPLGPDAVKYYETVQMGLHDTSPSF